MEEPEPPAEAPIYLKEGLPNQTPAMLLALARWAEELAAYKQEQPPEVDEGDELIVTTGPGHVKGYSRIVKYQRCGDDSCKCTSGTREDMHGPYLWHVYTTSGGRRVWSYQHKVSEQAGSTAA